MRTRFLPVWFLAVALIGVGWWQSNCDAARAATAYVTNNLDSGTGSLRWAVDNSANGDTVAIVTPGPININSPINISHNLTIAGPAIAVDPTKNPLSDAPAVSGQVAIVSGGSGSVFYISAGNVSMSHLYINGGRALGTSQPIGALTGYGDAALGGGIYNGGSLSLDYCTLDNNQALGGYGPDGGGNAYGGAIDSTGSLTINHSTFKNNSAIAGTGTNSTGSNNHAYGGGVYSTGATIILNSTFHDNVAQGGSSSSANGGFAEGGAVSVNSPGSLNITNSTFNINHATAASGTIVGGNAYGGAVSATVPLNPLDSTFVGNIAASVAGGSSFGSGVYYFSNSVPLTVNNCIIANNNGAANNLDAHPGFNAFGSPGVNIAPASVTMGSLAANGGPTETMSSSDGTYVVNVGDFGLASPPVSLDQRGAPRVAGGAQDAGAMENGATVPSNGAPATNPFTFQLVSGTANFTAQQFNDSLTYPGAPNQSLQGVVITGVTGGNLMLNGQVVPVGSTISVGDLNNLSFVSDGSGTPGFTWKPSDGTNTVPGVTVNVGEQPSQPNYVDIPLNQGIDNHPSLGANGISDPKITQLPPGDQIIYTDSPVSYTVKAQSVVPYNTVAPVAPATTPALDPTRSITLTVTETVFNNGVITGGNTWSANNTSSTTTAVVPVPCGLTQTLPGLHVINVTAVNGHNVSTTYTTSYLLDQIPVISNKNTITSPQSINLGDTFSQVLDATDPDYYVPSTSTTPDQLQFRVDQLCYGTGGTCDSNNTASNIGSFSDSNLTGNLQSGTTLATTFNWKPTQVGKYNLKVTLTDYWGFNDASFSFTVIVNPPANQPPVITNPGSLTAVKGTSFTQQIGVTDAENDPLTYNISGLPPGLIMTPTATGVTISGIPTTTTGSPFTVTLTANDGNHTTPTSATFQITVKDVGSPVIDNILVNGTALSSPVNVAANQDFNGLQATAHVNNYPDNLSFVTYEGTLANTVGSWNVTNTTGSIGTNLTTSTAAFSWPNVPPGIHVVTVRVTAQNGEYDERQFTIQAGTAPTLSLNPAGPISVNAGTQVAIAATAQEASANATLTFSLNGAPAGVAFVGQSVFNNVPANTNEIANIKWTPTPAQVGSYTFNVVVTDGAGLIATQPITINVDPAPPNLPPTVQNPGAQTVNVGTNANIQITAQDPESQPLTYTATGLPAWASISSTTGLITGTPGVGDIGGPTSITVNVSDGVNTVSTTFTLTVVQTANQPPVVSNPGTWIVSAGSFGTISVFAHDPESQPLTYTASANLPTWVTLNPSAAGVILSGTPSAGDVGTTSVTINVSDGVNTVPVTFQIKVVASGVPTLQASPNAPANPEQVKLGDGYSKIFISTDSDYPETLTFSAVVANMADNSNVTGFTFLPMYINGSASTGTTKAEAFQWTPAAAGTYQVVVSVTDSQLHVTSLTFSIHVDSPPSISVIPSTISATPELPLSIPVNVTDPDSNETLSLSLGTGTPSGMAFSGSGLFVNVPANTTQTAQLNWTPADTDANTSYTFNVIVTDSGGQTATQSVTINVGDINQPPTITNPGTITLITGHAVTIPISASDPEGDNITYHVSASPSGLGLSIDSNGVINGTVGPVGTYQETVTADDGYHVSPAASMTFTIIVKAASANRAPVWLNFPNQTVSVGQNVSIDLKPYVSDPDHDSVTLSDNHTLTVPGLILTNGVITGIPTTAGGPYAITITADDGYGGTSTAQFDLTVLPNQPPFSRTLSDYNLYVGNNLYVDASTTDPEGDSITYGTTAPLPFGATINSHTGIITGTAATPYGSFPVTVTATDSGGHSTSYPPFTINVLSPFTVGFANSGNGYATITYTLLNNTNAAITPTVTGSLTGAGYTDNANAFFVASQGLVADQWANPIIQRRLDPTKDTRILTWTLGTLAPGNSATLTISVPVNANTSTSQQLTNQWTAQYGTGSGSVTLNLNPVTLLTGP